MSLAALVLLALKASILTIVFALGLTARPGDLLYLLRRPRELARSLLSMSVIMPIVAFALVRVFDLLRPAAIMLVALSLAPVPPILPRKQTKAHGHAAYSIGLLVAAAVISVVWIPLALEVEQRLFACRWGFAVRGRQAGGHHHLDPPRGRDAGFIAAPGAARPGADHLRDRRVPAAGGRGPDPRRSCGGRSSA